MKKNLDQVPVADLQRVAQALFDGLWGDDAPTTLSIKNYDGADESSEKRAERAVERMHTNRVARALKHQTKVRNLDLLLLGITDDEVVTVQAAIDRAVRDYLRPLATLAGLWDDDEEGTSLAVAGAAEGDKTDADGAADEQK